MSEFWSKISPIGQLAIGLFVVVAVCFSIFAVAMFLQDPKGNLKSAWLWVVTYNNVYEDKIVKTWAICDHTKLGVMFSLSLALNIWFTGRLDGWWVIGAISLGLCLVLNVLLMVYYAKDVYYSIPNFYKEYDRNDRLARPFLLHRMKDTIFYGPIFLFSGIVFPLAAHFWIWSLGIIGLIVLGAIGYSIRNKARAKKFLAAAIEAGRVEREVRQAQADASLALSMKQKEESDAANAKVKADQVAKKLEEHPLLVAEVAKLTRELAEAKDLHAYQVSNLTNVLRSVLRSAYRARIYIEKTKLEGIVDKRLGNARAQLGIVIGSARSLLPKDEVLLTELEVCRELNAVPEKSDAQVSAS